MLFLGGPTMLGYVEGAVKYLKVRLARSAATNVTRYPKGRLRTCRGILLTRSWSWFRSITGNKFKACRGGIGTRWWHEKVLFIYIRSQPDDGSSGDYLNVPIRCRARFIGHGQGIVTGKASPKSWVKGGGLKQLRFWDVGLSDLWIANLCQTQFNNAYVHCKLNTNHKKPTNCLSRFM